MVYQVRQAAAATVGKATTELTLQAEMRLADAKSQFSLAVADAKAEGSRAEQMAVAMAESKGRAAVRQVN